MLRSFLITLFLGFFASAAASAQPLDVPGKDKADKKTEQTDRSGGLGRSRGGGNRDKEESKDEDKDDERLPY